MEVLQVHGVSLQTIFRPLPSPVLVSAGIFCLTICLPKCKRGCTPCLPAARSARRTSCSFSSKHVAQRKKIVISRRPRPPPPLRAGRRGSCCAGTCAALSCRTLNSVAGCFSTFSGRAPSCGAARCWPAQSGPRTATPLPWWTGASRR